MSDGLTSLRKRKTGGHYARLMGTLWRHKKPELAGDAALGMWCRMVSYCADVGRSVLSKREMAIIMAYDKNGPRKLSALLKAKLVDEVEGGYSPHDFYDHNPGISPSTKDAQDADRDDEREEHVRDGEEHVTTNVTGIVTRNVSNDVEQKQLVRPPSSRPRTQDPGDIPSLRSGGERASAPPAEGLTRPAVPESGVRPAVDVFGLQLALGTAADQLGWDCPPQLYPGQLAQAAKRVPKIAQRRGISRDDAALELCRKALLLARETGKSVAFALLEVDTAAPSPRAATRRTGGRMAMAPATTHEDFADAEPMDVQLARLREA